MDKQLLNDLHTLQKAVKKKGEIIEEQILDVTVFMSKDIVKNYKENNVDIESPKKPHEPKLELIREYNVEEEIEKRRDEYKVKPNIKLATSVAIWTFVILLAIGISLLIMGNSMVEQATNSLPWQDHDQTAGNTVLTISYVFFITALPLPAILWLIIFLPSLSSSKKLMSEKLDKDIKELEVRLENIKETNIKNKEKYDADMKVYIVKKQKYEEQLNEYKEKTKAKNKAIKDYEKEKERAHKELSKHNQSIVAKAEKYIDDVLSSIKTTFPKKYIYDLDTIVDYLENSRADTLKEAINLFELEKAREKAGPHTYICDVEYWNVYGTGLKPITVTANSEAEAVNAAMKMVSGATKVTSVLKK